MTRKLLDRGNNSDVFLNTGELWKFYRCNIGDTLNEISDKVLGYHEIQSKLSGYTFFANIPGGRIYIDDVSIEGIRIQTLNLGNIDVVNYNHPTENGEFVVTKPQYIESKIQYEDFTFNARTGDGFDYAPNGIKAQYILGAVVDHLLMQEKLPIGSLDICNLSLVEVDKEGILNIVITDRADDIISFVTSKELFNVWFSQHPHKEIELNLFG